MDFVHLHTHSYFSFLDGTASPAALVKRAKELGMTALAVTDHHNLTAIPGLCLEAARQGIKPLAGCEITLENGAHLLLLADGAAGYTSLCRLLTEANFQNPRGGPRVSLESLGRHAHGLAALSGCRRGEIPRLILARQYQKALERAGWYQKIFDGAFYLEMQRNFLPGDAALNGSLKELGLKAKIPLVVTGNVHYIDKIGFPAYDLLSCVREGITLEEAHPARKFNAENYFQSPKDMFALWRDEPRALENTLNLAARLKPPGFSGARHFPQLSHPEGKPAPEILRELVRQGAINRYGSQNRRQVNERLRHELQIIEAMGFEDYFLLVWDLIREARRRGIRYAGRGSAADSAVAYCLEITEVDPLARGLLFERFMSPERAESPDIDLDFDYRYRDLMAGYLVEKYGPDRVAHLATYNTYQARGAVRDLGKVLGYQPEEIDKLAHRLPHLPADALEEAWFELPELKKGGLDFKRYQPLIKAAGLVAGIPRFYGTHLGGVVVADCPLVEISPLKLAAKGVTTVQFDKDDCETAGLIKLDLLSCRTLAAVEDAVRAIKILRPAFDYAKIPLKDPAAYRMIRAGETVGVFQLESPAQRALQARLGAETMEDIIASLAIIRPGPIKGDMVEPFIARRQGREPVTYAHPDLQPILQKTYGVVLFQEQVIEIATAIAGFTPGEADLLRRVMTHARSQKEMAAIGEEFKSKAVKRGIPLETAETVFNYMAGYASYGFCEAHSAAFAVTSFKTAYLIRHYPAQYLCGLFNHQPLGFYPPGTLAVEAHRRGVKILDPEINVSGADFQVEGAKAIRIGLKQVKDLSRADSLKILQERQKGVFRSLEDCYRRLRLPRDQMENLILAGAFDQFSPNRRSLLWTLQALPGGRQEGSSFKVIDFSPEERLKRQYQVLGLTPGTHCLALRRGDLKAWGFKTSAELKRLKDGCRVKTAGFPVRPHRPPTKSGRITVFLSLEDEFGLSDITVFEDVYREYGQEIFRESAPPLLVEGILNRRGTGVSVIAQKIAPLKFEETL